MALQKRLLLLSLIRYFVFSFPLQVYTPWWKTWIISCKVGTNFRAGHFSKSPIAENIMQIPSLSKLQKEVAIYIWTEKTPRKSRYLTQLQPIQLDLLSRFHGRPSLNLLSTSDLFFPDHLITFRLIYIERNLINSFHWPYIPYAP